MHRQRSTLRNVVAKKSGVRQVSNPGNNSQQTVSLLRKAYDCKKKRSVDRKMTLQNPKVKKMAGVNPGSQPMKASVMTTNANINKVFNINVVTEDGRTEFEDYPHEIDL